MENTKSKKVAAQLIDVRRHNKEVYTFEFKSDEIKSWTAGDSSKLFLLVKDKTIGKKFSFATVKEENRILFTTRIKEEKSEYKTQLQNLQYLGYWSR